MNKIIDALKAIRAPHTNTPLAIGAVVIAAVLGVLGVVVDASTVLNVLMVLVPLVGGILQWNTKELTEDVDTADEEVEPVVEAPVAVDPAVVALHENANVILDTPTEEAPVVTEGDAPEVKS